MAHATLRPKMTKDLYDIAVHLKGIKDPQHAKEVMEVFIKGNHLEDMIIQDDLNNMVRDVGFFSSEHFLEVILNTTHIELQEAMK